MDSVWTQGTYPDRNSLEMKLVSTFGMVQLVCEEGYAWLC